MHKPYVGILALILAAGCESESSDSDPETTGGRDSATGGRDSATGGRDTSTGGTTPAEEGGAAQTGGSDSAAGEPGTLDEGGTNGEGGAPGQGGESPTGGTSTGGAATGGTPASSGDLAVSPLSDCRFGSDSYCVGTDKPDYWECPKNPDEPPYEGCEHAETGGPAQWCCPSPFCSPYPGVEAVCPSLDTSKPHGYICAPDAPGLDQCVSFVELTYCCP